MKAGRKDGFGNTGNELISHAVQWNLPMYLTCYDNVKATAASNTVQQIPTAQVL